MQTVTTQSAAIPQLGFGTFELVPDDAHDMTGHALDVGYHHIDTAQIYGNEDAVGAAIGASGVARDDIFLTTKVWVSQFANGDLQRSAEQSLKRLDMDYVNLLLLHWPNPDVPLAETLKALAEVKRAGLTRHIGISNFTTRLIDQTVAQSSEPLVTNQVEYHPYLSQAPVLGKLAEHNMTPTAYCPLAQGRVFNDATLADIARAHDKTGGHIALRWLLQQGCIAIPRSSKKEHVSSNLEVFDFALSDDEMQAIAGLAEPDGRIINPASIAPDWD